MDINTPTDTRALPLQRLLILAPRFVQKYRLAETIGLMHTCVVWLVRKAWWTLSPIAIIFERPFTEHNLGRPSSDCELETMVCTLCTHDSQISRHDRPPAFASNELVHVRGAYLLGGDHNLYERHVILSRCKWNILLPNVSNSTRIGKGYNNKPPRPQGFVGGRIVLTIGREPVCLRQ